MEQEYYFIYDVTLADTSISYFVPIKYRSLFGDISQGREGVKYTGKENKNGYLALSFTITGAPVFSENAAERKLFDFMDEIRSKHNVCFTA